MPKCKNNPTRSYKGSEPSPKGLGYCASGESIGKKRKGKDGNMWIVKEVSNGSKRWVKHNIYNIEKFNKKLLDVISDKFESKLDEKLNKALENSDLNLEVPNIPIIVKEDPFDPKVWLEVGSKGYYNDE